ncbi:hypothetical protein JB92DRAFT_3149561 [Gautieria morchelliformis]|nr:hypothetical protein JB92DRAFT_3149561 [Gautieria morchelliformis]
MSSSFMPTKYRLSRELIDIVIDHFHDDLPSLRACCLTCRSWVPRARFHIFRNIVLSAKHADALAMILKKSPHILSLVRSLTIYGHPEGILAKRLDYLDVAIPLIAPKLIRLKTLRVERMTLAHQHPKVLSTLIHNVSTLQELRIATVEFNRFRDLAALIVAHPFLQCLDLGYIWWTSVREESHWENVFQEYPDLRSRLRCFKLDHISLSVLDWMSSYYHILPVHTVTQSIISISDISHMARLFQTIGSSLEHLHFCIYQNILETPVRAKMDLLSSNTGLRTLTFDSFVHSRPRAEPYAWLPVLLSQVTSRYIEEITFVFSWNQVNLIETMDLKLVQDIITKPVFSGLKRVIFQWRGPVDPVEASQAIRARMDKLDGMGLLVLEFI